MKSLLPALSIQLLILASSAALYCQSSSNNIAFQKEFTAILTGYPSSNSTSSITKLTDGIRSSSNFFELVPGNVGARFTIDLGHIFPIDSVRAIPFISNAVDVRLRGYDLRVSADGVGWTSIASDSNNTSAIALMIPDSNCSARWVEIIVTAMSPDISTVLGEIEVWTVLDRPTVTNIKVTSSILGPQYRDVVWTTFLLDSSRIIELAYLKVGSGDTTIFASIANSGRVEWRTEFLADGQYIVFAKPDTLPSNSFNYLYSLSNFSNAAIRVHEDTLPPYGGAWPVTYSEFLQDSIQLDWTFTWAFDYDHNQELSFSPDSGASWHILKVSIDKSIRSIKLPTTVLQKGVRDGLFRLSVIYNDQVLLSVTTATVVQVPSPPIEAHFVWAQSTPGSLLGSSGGLLSYKDSLNLSRIIAGVRWILLPNGATLPNWNKSPYMLNYLAAGDMDNDGVTEFVTQAYGVQGIAIISDTGSFLRPRAVYQGVVWDTHLADFDVDGFLDIIVFNGAVVVVDRNLTNLGTYFSGTAWSDALALNVSGDVKLEIVAVNSDSIYAYNQLGQSLSGFPRSLPTASHPSTITPLDVNEDGLYEFLVGSINTMYCITGTGTISNGFAYTLPAQLLGKPAIGDINDDGHNDIAFITGGYSGNLISPAPQVHCVDRYGISLPGWPLELPAGFAHRINFYSDMIVEKNVSKTFLNLPSEPLIASIDGDEFLEILITTAAGELIVLNRDGTVRPGYPVFLGTRSKQSGVLGDFDNDGSLNFVFPMYLDRPDRYVVMNADFGPGTYREDAIPWPMKMQNSRKTRIAPAAIPVGIVLENTDLPITFSLSQNYPNPFNPSTTIRYSLPKAVQTTVRISDMLGRTVATLVDEFQNAGMHSVQFDGSGLASGVYFLQIVAGQDRSVRKMLLMK